jgi:hypothetical protein
VHAHSAAAAQPAQQLGRFDPPGVGDEFRRAARGEDLVELSRIAAEALHSGVHADGHGQVAEALCVAQTENGGAEPQLAVLGRLALRRAEHQSGPAHFAGLVEREIREVVGHRSERVGHAGGAQAIGVGLDHGHKRDVRAASDGLGGSANPVEIDEYVDVSGAHFRLPAEDLRVGVVVYNRIHRRQARAGRTGKGAARIAVAARNEGGFPLTFGPPGRSNGGCTRSATESWVHSSDGGCAHSR